MLNGKPDDVLLIEVEHDLDGGGIRLSVSPQAIRWKLSQRFSFQRMENGKDTTGWASLVETERSGQRSYSTAVWE